MKIRTITIGLELQASDFVGIDGICLISSKLEKAKNSLLTINSSLKGANYEVQTLRVALNSFEEWLLNGDINNDSLKGTVTYVELIKVLVYYLEKNSIELCSIGCCSSGFAISLVPSLLAVSERLYCSALFKKDEINDIAPDVSLVRQAAQTLLDVTKTSGVFGCFRFCASFNCSGGTPFFPAAYYEKDVQSKAADEVNSGSTSTNSCNNDEFLVSIGLECADLLFIGFHGAPSVSEGSRNLSEVMKQALLPIQSIVSAACDILKINYGGIDASINPGMSLPDSVGAGLENLLFFPQKATSSLSTPVQQFGEFGTLAAVSAVTKAVKSLPSYGIKLTGYNGLMLPVMEDLILADRAAQIPPTFSLRDLLIFSSVCGVGLDTVPVPGNISAETIAAVYTETAALAFRLNKPLTCRLLVMENKVAGDMTNVTHSYICNTRVFSI